MTIIYNQSIAAGASEPIVNLSATRDVFSPINSVLKAWWSLSDYSSLTLSSTKITQILDKSGNNNTITQATDANRPTFSGTAFSSTYPGATFSTSDIGRAAASPINNIFAGGGAIVMNLTITGTNGGNGTIIAKSTDPTNLTTGWKVFHYGAGPANIRFAAKCATQTGIWDIGGLVFDRNYVLKISWDSSSPTTDPVISLNGVPQTVTVAQAPIGAYVSDASDALIIGNNSTNDLYPFVGKINQAMLFKGAFPSGYEARLIPFLGQLSGIPTYPIYGLFGQSNAVGNATTSNSYYQAGLSRTTSNQASIWTGASFQPLAAAANNNALDSGSFGPEITFTTAKYLTLQNPVYLVKYAVAATSLAVDWAPTSGTQWTGMKAAVDAAFAAAPQIPAIPLYCGTNWVQGETDAQSLNNATNYATNLTTFISQFNSVVLASYLISPNNTFVIAGLGNLNLETCPYTVLVTQNQLKVVNSVSNTTYVYTKDLTLNSDGVHYAAAGQVLLGQRLAAASN